MAQTSLQCFCCWGLSLDSKSAKAIALIIALATPLLASAPALASDNPMPPRAELESNIPLNHPGTLAQNSSISGFEKFSVGVNIGKVNVVPGTLVRGKTDGSRAIDLPKWLLSYQDVIEGLKFRVKTLPDGQVEIRTPNLVTRIDPKKLQTDPDLGLVFSIEDLGHLFGIKAEFDIAEYAIKLTVPWTGQEPGWAEAQAAEAPIILAGLPRIKHPDNAITSIQQHISIASGTNTSTTVQGDIALIGSVGGYSGYLQINQPNLLTPATWNLSQFQLAKATETQDWTIGSQSPFWRSQGNGGYWGVTTVYREGFRAPAPAGGAINLPQRLQSIEFGNTIIGKALPGTLVRLTQGFSDNALAEVLVDANGQYRFENVKGSSYRLLLYPNGQLTQLPEKRNVSFNQVFGQIPPGTAVTLLSGGVEQQPDSSSFWGSISGVRGGVARRWGISEDLTLGAGVIYDHGLQGLGEVFWRPSFAPIQVSLSTLMGSSIDLSSTINYQPSPALTVNLSIDRLSTKARAYWQIAPAFGLTATYDPQDVGALEAQYTSSSRDSYTFASASFDTMKRLRWYLKQRWGLFQIGNQGNEQKIALETSYDFSPDISTDGGSSVVLNYELNNLQSATPTAWKTLGWRYLSPARTSEGTNAWEAELGYGFGSLNQGMFVSAGVAVLPGLMLRGSYQAATPNGSSALRLDLVSNLNLSNGLQLGEQKNDALRSQGGILLKPFFDHNANGKRDSGEKSYVEDLDLLMSINNRSINSLRPIAEIGGVSVRILPGSHRIDFDPAGFPSDWQADREAVAVDVAAGAYTTVSLPLIRSYVRSGTVMNADNKPLEGAKVEAIGLDRQLRIFSITNAQGLFTLQGLRVGKYRVEINGQPIRSIEILPTAVGQNTLNFQL
jgi:hypothetical protein